jgi:hypothetical protein
MRVLYSNDKQCQVRLATRVAVKWGGVSILAGSGGGIWLLLGTVLVFVAASVNARVLLVEIHR